MKNQTFGIEIETTGLGCERTAKVLAQHFGTTARYSGRHLGDWHIPTPDGRKCLVERDASVTAPCAEVVSPVRRRENIPMVQEVVRALREAGARTDSSCGIHVHVGFSLERPAKAIEFRAFNGTLHTGKIKAYIQLCLAISAQALTTKAASPTRPVTDNPKYTFRCWLLRLGFIGDEFETARTHLLANLPGNAHSAGESRAGFASTETEAMPLPKGAAFLRCGSF